MTDAAERDVALVTGANGAIGAAISRGIAEAGDYEVVLLCRDRDEAERTRSEIRDATDCDAVRYALCDVSRRSEVYELADDWEGPLDVLVNNAAATPPRRRETPEGLEVQFATNVMGYFWMIRAFEEVLAASAPTRVVNVASYWAGDLDLDDLQFERRSYDNGTAYRQSKQADRMLTRAFAERLEDRGVAVNACHPGDTPSKLSKNLGFHGHESPEEAADTPVWLATSPAGRESTGAYFKDRRTRECRFMADRDGVERLYEICGAHDPPD